MPLAQQRILGLGPAEPFRRYERPPAPLTLRHPGCRTFPRPQRRWVHLGPRPALGATGSSGLSSSSSSSSSAAQPRAGPPAQAAQHSQAAADITDAASAAAASYYHQAQQQQQQQQQGVQEQQGAYRSLAAQWRAQHRAAQQQQQQQAQQAPHSPRAEAAQAGPAAAYAAQTSQVASQQPRLPYRRAGHVGLATSVTVAAHAPQPPPPPPSRLHLKYFTVGALAAVLVHYALNFVGTLPVVRYFVRRFIWWRDPAPPPAGAPAPPMVPAAGGAAGQGAALMQYSDDGESVEWINMCWRKMWRVYQRGIERWLADLLQPLFDLLVAEAMVPAFVQRLRILEFTLDHEAPYFTNMRRRTSRKDSDLTGVVDVRYTGGARMVLLIEVGTGRWRIKIPVLVSDLDLECRMWIKIRLAPMAPYIGTLSLAFVGPPTIKVQLSPYGKVRLMRIPILQAFLTKFFTVDLPGLMVLPKRLEINIPPAVTAVAEAAVGRDAVMRAVASAVLQADALEHALLAALPLGPQGAAGGVSLPESFRGELSVTLHEARELPVWGFPWQSNPYCRLALGNQAVQSRRDVDTSHAGRHREPVWNQEFQFLVEDPSMQTLEIWVRDSPVTGRREVGYASFPLKSLPQEGTLDIWLPVESSMPGERSQGLIHLSMSYKSFSDDEGDSGYREARAFQEILRQQAQAITDVKSAADASSRAAVAASAAATAVAVTKAAAARAATRLARSASSTGSPSGSSLGSAGAAAGAKEGAAAGEEGAKGNGSSAGTAAAAATAANGSRPAPPRSEGDSSSSEDEGRGNGSNGSGGAAGSQAGAKEAAAVAAQQAQQMPAGPSAATGSVDLGTLAKAITETLQQATLEQQQLEQQLEQQDAAAAAAGAAGAAGKDSSASAAPVLTPDGLVVGPPHAVQVEALPVERLQQITAAMHDMKLEVDRALYAPAAQQAQQAQQAHSQQPGGSSGTGSSSGSGGVGELGGGAVVTAPAGVSAADVAQGAAEVAGLAAGVAAAAAAAAGGAGGASASDGAAASRADDASADAAKVADLAASMAAAAAAAEEAAARAAGTAVSIRREVDAAVPAVPAVVAAGAAAVAETAEDSEEAGEEEDEGEDKDGGWWGGLVGFFKGEEGQEEEGRKGKGSKESGSESAKRAAVIVAEEESGDGVVREVVLPPDLPLDAIAEEVQKSWRMKEVHVEALIQKAMEARRKQNERPWLVILSITSAASAVLLSMVLYRLMHMQ